MPRDDKKPEQLEPSMPEMVRRKSRSLLQGNKDFALIEFDLIQKVT